MRATTISVIILSLIENRENSTLFKITAVSLHLYSPPYLECCSSEDEKVVPFVYSTRCISLPKHSSSANLHPHSHSSSVESPSKSKDTMLERILEIEKFVTSPCTNLTMLIKTVENVLNSPNPDHSKITDFLQKVKFHPQQLLEYVENSSEEYSRCLVGRSETFEVNILCFQPGNSTAVHDHGNSNLYWRKVISGEITETVYCPKKTPLTVCERKYVLADSTSFSLGKIVHKVENRSEEPALAIYIYSPPLTCSRTYN